MYYSETQYFTVRVVAASSGTTVTYLGVLGYQGSIGDGGVATSARIGSVDAIAFDNNGNLYVSDESYHTVRKVTASTKIVSRIAGVSSAAGYNGDYFSATSAYLYTPSGIAFDKSNQVYISEYNNCRIRTINSAGIITTFAGIGCSTSPDGYAATSAYLSNPSKITFTPDYKYLFIAEWSSGTIRKIDMTTTILTTAAGIGGGFSGDGTPVSPVSTSNVRFSGPTKVVFTPSGDYFITDRQNQRVRFVTGSTGIIQTIAGNGGAGYGGNGLSAVGTSLYNPDCVALDKNGVLYICDMSSYRIRYIGGRTFS